MTDSEHSDAEVSYTDNGTFNLSRGQTPLTEGSEGLYKFIAHFILLFSSVFLFLTISSSFGQISTDTVMLKNLLLKTSQTSPP